VIASDIPAESGIFHMAISPSGDQLWVNNEFSRSISIIDPQALTAVTTIATPSDLGVDARPHDVIIDPDGNFAYVTLIGAAGPNDFVVKYSTSTFQEVDRQSVGKDPHVSLTPANKSLYVPTQNSDQLAILERTTLDPVMSPLALVHAHGIMPTGDGQLVYLTSFPGNAPQTGQGGLHVMDTTTNTIVNSVDAPDVGAGPHNIGLASDESRLFVTHTGSSMVSVFDITGSNRTSPVLLTTATVGANPFGITAIPAVPEPCFTWLLGCGLCAAGRWRSRMAPSVRTVRGVAG
jgi:DNA-binding beta-propeller fold protein YncE